MLLSRYLSVSLLSIALFVLAIWSVQTTGQWPPVHFVTKLVCLFLSLFPFLPVVEVMIKGTLKSAYHNVHLKQSGVENEWNVMNI